MSLLSRPAVCIIDTGISVDAFPEGTVHGGINLSGVGDAEDVSEAKRRHGSLVAETILRQIPSARLVVVKLLDGDGWLHDNERVDAAFEWICRQRDALGITVVCAALADMSHLRSDATFRDTPLCRYVAALRSYGVATVVPAGNWYPQFSLSQPQGMAWPAILREAISVGALDPTATYPVLHPYSQRLHAQAGTGCTTTVFSIPGAPGDTSGAAAVVAGRLATLRQAWPTASVEGLIAHLLAAGQVVRDEAGLAWPAAEMS